MVFSMMRVQKGQVKYKDRSDIICTYGINDAGKQYYFLDGEKLSNGNLIASTALVEAIDPLVVASNIGVISGVGDIVVPFENKAIKAITDNAILVEKAIPSTPSVIEAISMRKDPLAATKLVTTPATIKGRINAKMGDGGRFVFNDQFSEASVFDLNGNNLLNGQYYSFIGLNNGNLYLSKNTIDSDIVEYKLDKDENGETNKLHSDDLLDVQDVKVAPKTIDDAMEQATNSKLSDNKAAESFTSEQSKDAEEEKQLHAVSFQPLNDASEFKDVEIDEEDKKTENIFIPKKVEKETRVSLFEGLKFDNDEVSNKDEESVNKELGGTIISDTAEMLTKLIKQNKEQREKILSNEAKISDLLSFKRQAFDENQLLVKENEKLKSRIKELESELNKKNDKLEDLNAQVAKTDDLAKILDDAKKLLNE